MARFDENTRVKFPATIQFMRLGYKYVSLKSDDIDFDTRIFKNRFRMSLEKINNRKFTDDEINSIIHEINSLIERKDMGKAFYHRLIGIDGNDIKLVDFDNIDNNDFAVTCELPFAPDKDTNVGSFRPDVIALINGMPLGFLEVKIPNNQGGIQKEFKRMLDDRLKNPKFEKYFNFIQFVAFSNNLDYESADDTVMADQIRQGSFYSTPNGFHTYFNFFRESSETKKTTGFVDVQDDEIKALLKDNGYRESEFDVSEFQTNLDMNTPCNSFVTSFFEPERILFMLNYGFCYVNTKDSAGNPHVEKHIMRYPQFFAARAILERLESGEKSGIIWHTQGSGKTELAAYSNRIISDYYAKKGIVTRFFFIVDRLDLLRQARDEFENRGIVTTSIAKKDEFAAELNRSISNTVQGKNLGSFTVVNVQKIIESVPVAKNAYGINVQRIFFIDEAHRSYKNAGEYFKNLKMCDLDGAFIALTATPILSKSERSNLKFGDYIHKYFYNESIADGYTLRIKKENVNKLKKEDIKHNLELEDPDSNEEDVVLSDAFVNDLCGYIENDFINFRLVNQDKTTGAMIVCGSNPMAKSIGKWFEENGKLTAGVVITDASEKMQAARNKQLQEDFKYKGTPDILIVHQMLTTGYDVHRLKKMYLLRHAHDQTLLQTISRVNRPYKAPNGKVYNYGYITDFVDIDEEFEKTIGAYLDELEKDANIDDEGSLKGVILGPNEIYNRYNGYYIQVQTKANIDGNVEEFQQSVSKLPLNDLYLVRKALQICIDCTMELKISGSSYANNIDLEKLKKCYKETQNRISGCNMKDHPCDMLAILNDNDIVDIVYDFVKTSSAVMNLGNIVNSDKNPDLKAFSNMISNTIKDIKQEIDDNRNRNQSDLIKLDKVLADLFARLDIRDINDLNDINDDLKQVLAQLHQINLENQRLSEKYDGQYAFVKMYTDILDDDSHADFDKDAVETVVSVVYESVKDNTDKNHLLMQGRDNFVAYNLKKCNAEFIKNKLYKELRMKDWFKDALDTLYTDLQLMR